MPVLPTDIERCATIAREFGATRLILFGSAAESPETARDLDLACEGITGWDLFRLGARLEQELTAPVDLIPLRPDDRFSRYVESKGRVIYDAR
ncbi:MAG: DNA polymerase III subunit beta [Planctomycetales bacterium]|nr:DNA polymerase III subunit beta [Planctomycetales bacterium]NIP71161.1 DNA polymerase III subunit beta [Planctomycetales bacterium]